MKRLLQSYAASPQLRTLRHWLSGSGRELFCAGLQGSAPAMVTAALAAHDGTPAILAVMNSEEEAGYFHHDLGVLLGEERVLFFPSPFRRAVKYGQRDDGYEILRTEVLGRLLDEASRPVIVTYPEALAVRVAAREEVSERSVTLRVGQSVEPTALERQLLDLGMTRCDYVYEPGQFAVRGSIVDVFSYSCEQPLRIDFFGDDIDSIRTFDVATQLSDRQRGEAVIMPAVDSGDAGLVPLTKFLPKDTLTVWQNRATAMALAARCYDEGFLQQAHLTAADGDEPLDKTRLLLPPAEVEAELTAFRALLLGEPTGQKRASVCRWQMAPQPLLHKNFELICQAFEEHLSAGDALYILADNAKQHERLRDIFDEMNRGIRFTPVEATLHAGWSDANLKLCVFTDHQIFDRFHKYSLKSEKTHTGKAARLVKEMGQFEPGDYVTHIDHGIGRFVGLVRIQQGGTEQEVMKLTFNGGDVVYVSIHALNKVSKYKANDGEAPRLSRLGTGAWDRLKDRTKKKIKDIARDLIRLYAARRKEQGFAFSPDTYMQHELEASFIYEDTPDQIRATADIKRDMESPRPMDRLVCGDVGFGKTELAVRAAFKAAADSKQVAVLVPTTVLAYQHFQTFSERLRDFPVRIEYLSRARSAEKTRQIKADLKRGAIDILIGTHKLLGKGIEFKDLGLLIVDEEQKFGVATKERLRQLRVNVDTLTLSATPIPRTLQFSLMGARDLSLLQTPPANRYPIHTEIHTFEHEIIAEAINFELSRNGQIFFVCSRIAQLDEVKHLIQKHVPDARVAIGHGQMPPEQLERVIFDFLAHDYDVLLSTTIVENGVDMPNVNTIIISGANHFGLSDLHQMRGRVGRSNRKAFCYLLAPPLGVLPDESRRRLEAIQNFSDLGSGFNIAMQDLDLRGAGNLLGAEQSGFIADLGYETYQKILQQAVSELRNDEFSDLYSDDNATQKPGSPGTPDDLPLTGDAFVTECNIDTDLPLYLPEEYIPGSAERMAFYRELSTLRSDQEVAAYRQRLEDRFGPLPEPSQELLHVVSLRRIARSLGIERLLLKQGRLTLYYVANLQSAFYQSRTFGRSIAYIQQNHRRCAMQNSSKHCRIDISGVPNIAAACEVLTAIATMPSA